jgi:CheY-like chemotaxis protein
MRMKRIIINFCRAAMLACSFAFLSANLPGQGLTDTNSQTATVIQATNSPLTNPPASSGTAGSSVIPIPADALPKVAANQGNTNPIIVKVLTEQNEMVLKYEEFLRQETMEHHELIQTSYKIAAGLVGLVVAILGIFGFKTIRDIKKNAATKILDRVEIRMQEAIDRAIEERKKWIEETHRASRLKIFREFRSVFGSLFEAQPTLLKKSFPGVATIAGLHDKKILWVDDDPVGIACQVAILGALHAQVTLKQTTEDALSELTRYGFDLVISNMNRSPDATAGVELAKRIRETSQVPILIFTRDVHIKNHGQKAREAGANELESETVNLIPTIYRLVAQPKIVAV